MVGRLVSVEEGYLAFRASFLAAGSDKDEGGSASNKSKCGTNIGIIVAALSLGMSQGELEIVITLESQFLCVVVVFIEIFTIAGLKFFLELSFPNIFWNAN